MIIQRKNEFDDEELIMNEQQRLLDAIWHDDTDLVASSGFDAHGINIYRRNLLANAQRALSISFPTVFELLDSDISEEITGKFLKSSPPSQGDWAQWGNEFASFIKSTNIACDYPYLSDCTALDWHVHCALHGIDQTFEQSSLQLLSHCEPENIFIEFNHNVKLLESIYPITEIFYAHHDVDDLKRKAFLESAQLALSSKLEKHTVMVFRPEFQPKVTILTAGEEIFMRSLMSEKSLAQALIIANENSQFSFEQWLVKAIELNLINNFREKKL